MVGLHLHPLPGDENRYSPEEFERDVKPHIKFGPDPNYVRLPRGPAPEWLKSAPAPALKIDERLYSDSHYLRKMPENHGYRAEKIAKRRYDLQFPNRMHRSLSYRWLDATASEIHSYKPGEMIYLDGPPTLWRRFMAWLKGE